MLGEGVGGVEAVLEGQEHLESYVTHPYITLHVETMIEDKSSGLLW